MKVCGVTHVRVYYFPSRLFHRFTLTSQVQHDNELYFVTGGVVSSLGKGIAAASRQPFLKPVVST